MGFVEFVEEIVARVDVEQHVRVDDGVGRRQLLRGVHATEFMSVRHGVNWTNLI
jgi:hypothetical protein